MAVSRLAVDLRQLAGNSAIYASGVFLVRGLSLLLLPLYTRYLTPSDYGIVAFSTAVASVLAILFTLGLNGSVTYLYFKSNVGAERRRSVGTVWLSILAIAGAMVLVLQLTGTVLFRFATDVPFDPYLRLAVWIAFFNVLTLIPLNLLQVEERPARYAAASVCSAMLTAAFVIWLVVYQNEGAYGFLLGTLLAGAVMAAPYVVMTVRRVDLVVDRRYVATAFAYGFPLVLHTSSGWLLELSDRVILERYVTLEQLGLYSIGYLLGSVVYMFATTVNNALVPMIFRKMSADASAASGEIGELATYFAAALCWVALGVGLLADVLITIFTAPNYFAAVSIVPWIAAGMLVHSLYLIPANMLFAKGRTWAIARSTAIAGLMNVGLTVWWAPGYGILGAAWATFAAYALMLVLVTMAAQRAHRVAYETSRIAKLLTAAGFITLAGICLPYGAGWAAVTIRAVLWLAFPVLLLPLGFFRPGETSTIMQLLRRERV
jgi:O-antigen/teichoic acid export membrane protein